MVFLSLLNVGFRCRDKSAASVSLSSASPAAAVDQEKQNDVKHGMSDGGFVVHNVSGVEFWRKASVMLRPRLSPILFSRQVQPACICLPSGKVDG
jgi:hypothetical protein